MQQQQGNADFAQYLYARFREVDADGDGRVTADELQTALAALGYSMFNTETCRLLVNLHDFDQNGSIDFSEFSSMWNYLVSWHGIFRTFDVDGNGSIDSSELQRALLTFGYNVTKELVDVLVKKYDRYGQGSITFDSFIQCCVTIRALTDSFRRFDSDNDGWITLNYNDYISLVMTNRP
ncbi:Programmed cell death protein 6 [Allomyces javanicus]|nr:Programmed cell death protein 6 [Allomyces javanicus]